MPRNKVVKLELVRAIGVEEFSLSGNNVSLTLATGYAWSDIAMLPKPSFSSKPDITEEGKVYNNEFKAGVKQAPNNDFYIAKITFADGSARIIGTPNFPVYIITDNNFTDFAEISLSFKWKFDAILSYTEA